MSKTRPFFLLWPLLLIVVLAFLPIGILQVNRAHHSAQAGTLLAAGAPSSIVPEGYDLESIPSSQTINLNSLSAGEHTYVGEGDAKYFIVTGSTQHANLVFSGNTVILLDNASFKLDNGSAIRLSSAHVLTVVIAKNSVNTLIAYEKHYAALTADNGELKIYSQNFDAKESEQVGTLFAQGGLGAAAIGASNNSDIGNIEIYGGRIHAYSPQMQNGMVQEGSPAIGASQNYSAGNIHIENAEVTAESRYGAGIGAGTNGRVGDITIKSSKIEATGNYGAAIGAGTLADATAETITIEYSEILAEAYQSAVIGAGRTTGANVLGDILIKNSRIKAEIVVDPNSGDNGGSAIGAGVHASVLGDIYIEESDVTASSRSSAAIGGGNGTTAVVQSIFIKNSDIKANGYMGSGIGAGRYGAVSGKIEIEGGNIYAEGGNGGAGIGGGYYPAASVDSIKIKDAFVNAIGDRAAAIGGGNQGGVLSTIEITGGVIYATAQTGAAIGAGRQADLGGKLEIKDARVTASSGGAAAIGAGYYGKVSGDIILDNSQIEATGDGGAGVGAGQEGSVLGNIEIKNKTILIAVGKTGAAGVGGGYATTASVGSIAIENSEVTATGEWGAGIGGGFNAPMNGSIEITDSKISALSLKEGGAGIGAGKFGASTGKIEISGGTIYAEAENRSAGIGGGFDEDATVDSILISNAVVEAKGQNSAGIGGGYEGKVEGGITIQNGAIVTASTSGGAGIGGGYLADATVVSILISSATVQANGYSGAGVGGGYRGKVVDSIIIENGANLTVATTNGGAGIGAGYAAEATVNYISLEDAVIDARGSYAAGIGGGYQSGVIGDIEINGGVIYAESTSGGAGIGGGQTAAATVGTILIDNAEIHAKGFNGAGIGSGREGAVKDEIEINGGVIYAESTTNGAGIGGGHSAASSVGAIMINYAEVYAKGIYGGAGIGGGREGAVVGEIEINGGQIEASGVAGAGIGAGQLEDATVGGIVLNDVTVEANSSYGAGIGGGYSSGVLGEINISGGNIYASGYGAGIGAGYAFEDDADASVGSVMIENATIEAYGRNAAGIGGGYLAAVLGDIEINDSNIIASGYSAGIGGGVLGAITGDIKISGGKIYAEGRVVGIGNGYGTFDDDATIGLILIQDAYVEAIGQEGVGIGSGQDSVNATVAEIKIEGGEIFAYSLEYAAISADSVSITADAQVRAFSGNDDLPAIENYQGDAYLLQMIFDRQGEDDDIVINAMSSDASDFFQINLPQEFNSFSYTAKEGTYQFSAYLEGKLLKLIEKDALIYDIESATADDFYTIRAAQVYTVTLDLDGGAIQNETKQIIKIEVSEAEGIYLPTPTKSGQEFSGWTFGSDTYFNYIPSVQEDMTLKAQYGELYYTLTLDIAGVEYEYPVQRDENFLLFAPDADGKTFLYWEDADKNKYDGNTNFKVEKDVTLYAVFEESTYTLTLDIAGVEYEYPVQKGENFLLFAPNVDGKTFLHWEDADKNQYDGNTNFKVEKDVTLYAVFEESTYTLTLDIAGVEYEYPVQKGENFLLFAPNVDGKTFLHWEDADKNQYDGNTNFKVEKDVTLYAVFEDSYFTLILDVEGKQYEYPVTKNGEFLLFVPSAENKVFLYWEDADKKTYPGNTSYKVEADKKVLYAVFEDDNRVELREFSLEIDLNDGTGAILTYKVPENEAFTLGAPAERKGYKFIGWISEDNIHFSAETQTLYVRDNMKLTAQWEKDTLSLVWLYVVVGGLAVLTVTVFIAFLNVRYIKKKKMDELE